MKVIKTAGKSALIEWQLENGAPYRAWVPADSLEDNEAWHFGIPYGVPWSEVVALNKVEPHEIESALRNAGIWTYGDARKRPQAIVGILQALLGVDLSKILIAAKSYEEDKHNG